MGASRGHSSSPSGGLWSDLPTSQQQRGCSHFSGGGTVAGAGEGVQGVTPAHRNENGDPLGEDNTSQLSPGVLQGNPNHNPFPPHTCLPVALLLPSGSIPALRKVVPGCHLVISLGQGPWVTFNNFLFVHF